MVEWFLFFSIIILTFSALLLFVLYILAKKGGLIDMVIYRVFGGSLVVKSLPDNTVKFKRYKTAPDAVAFDTVDRNGKRRKYTIRIPMVKHMLHGTSNPIHFCPFNQQENINLNKKKQTAFTVQQWNEFAIANYEAGWNARGVLTGGNFLDLEKIQVILAAATVAMLAINFWFTYNIAAAVGS